MLQSLRSIRRVSLAMKGTTAVITLDDSKANAMHLDLFRDLESALIKAEENQAQGLVLAGRTGMFSAGLDVKKIPFLSGKDMYTTMETWARAMGRLYLFPGVTAAACAGHAFGGGMIAYAACDLKVAAMDDAFQLCLPEAKLGIGMTFWIAEILKTGLPPPFHRRLMMSGEAITVPQAARMHLVDVPVQPPCSQEQVTEAAVERVDRECKALGGNVAGYAQIKRVMRKGGWETALQRDVVEKGGMLSEEAKTVNFLAKMAPRKK